jgi:uncharacterized membrane protein YhhN
MAFLSKRRGGNIMGNGSLTKAILIAAILAGASYLFADHFGATGAAAILWKGAGVGLLALWCAVQARELDGWLIAAVMAFGALGDVLLEAVGLSVGAGAFIIGHVIAMLLYFRNRRPTLRYSQRLLAGLVVPLSVFVAATLVTDDQKVSIAAYTAFVSDMAASAWISRFPRYRTGIGAMMFLASDLLIFARMGPLAASGWVSPAIWVLYFGGQLLIAVGVVSTLRTAERGSTP